MNKNCIAIIPARSGSKRRPNKNIKDFLGKPIIAYSIEAALASGLFDEVVVSTDSEKIAEISKKYGAKVPFLRSEKNSNDFTGITDVLIEVIEEYKKIDICFDYVCCILATAPFITSNSLSEAFNLLKTNRFYSVFPVLKYSYPIQRALKVEDGKASMISPENYNKRSQDLSSSYHDAGQFYWSSSEVILEKKILFTENTGAIIFSDKVAQDIDTIDDWKLAELKYKSFFTDR